MVHVRRNKAVYENLDVNKFAVSGVTLEETAATTSVLTGATGTMRTSLIQSMTVETTALEVDVEGTTGDGFVALNLFTLPATRIAVIGAFADLAVTGVGAGLEIDVDSDIIMSIGSTATTDGTLATTDADIIASTAMTLIAGVKVSTEAVFAGTATLNIDAAGGASIYLNIGVPDADISADGTLNLTSKIRILYIDLSTGD